MTASEQESHTALDADFCLQQRDMLDRRPTVDLAAAAAHAKQMNDGRSTWFKKILQAVRGPGKLSVNEFFYYQLYDPAISVSDALRFVGKRAQFYMHKACNDQDWHAASNDKLLFYTTMQCCGFPIPETLAVFAPNGRRTFCRSIASVAELTTFVADAASAGVFAKPVDGMYSIGALPITGRAGDNIVLKDGTSLPVSQLTEFMEKVAPGGYMFQRIVEPHPEVVRLCGQVNASVRLLVTRTGREAVIQSAIVKLPRSASYADNYWREGNMIGSIDLTSGRVLRAVTGIGLNTASVATHPDTGVDLAGFQLPDWEQTMAMTLDAAACFPAIRTQSWDTCLSADGPKFLEMNFGGDLNLHQIAGRRGILTEEFCAHLRECGYRGKLPD